ncbi:ribonuclease III [Pseudovirgaria hyperparasitica]|uniref:Ribonuclease III n=1 Tax=Pseudovirgaria hyperparasitica TaxID=470096 RepID=A0A6A6VUB4_9PEZI|nr:ribonuclease III [Pseudovirgaria hyperparasitica]KAF2752837.1 ribonuclease III [Pseudovirgaria hyperparasitica]
MNDFYHTMRRKNPSLVPPILGLTASPVINSDPKALQTIEQNLDSHVTIPKIHQTEFLQHVHRPNLEPVFFQVDLSMRNIRSNAIMTALQEAYQGYDLASDPYIQDLYERMRYDPTAECKLTERYIVRCVDRLKDAVEMNEESHMLGWSGREKTHLMALLRKIVALVSSGSPAEGTSAKATALISYLKKAYHKDFRGLIFAERRAVVNALEDVIGNDLDLKQSFQVGAFVGTSSSPSRSEDVAELVDIKGQDQTLKDFREGRKNLIVTTSVLEEGIDVPNCNVVICFDAPTNLKMYVQRRGRARKLASSFVIMIPQNASESSSVTKWSTLEQILKDEYADESRQIKPMNSTELIDEADDYSLYVASTQALLTSDGVLPHLFHFCATLRTSPHTDHQPEFKLDTDNEGCFSAEVTLPLAVDASLRRHKGISKWKNEKDARKDAAFQAYKALHEAGLIGSNLLPLHGEVNEAPKCDMIGDRPAMVPVNPKMDPWTLHATAIGDQRYTYRIRFSSANHNCEFDVMTTMPLPTIPPYNLYWNKSLVYEVSYELQRDQPMHIEDDLVESLQKVAYHLLSSSLGSHRLVSNKFDFVVLLLPNVELSTSAVDDFVATTSGALPATILEKHPIMDGHSSRLGLVRRHGASERFVLQKIYKRGDEQSQGSKEYVLKVNKFPKRKDFLHQVDAREKQNSAYTAVLELELADSVIEMLPADLVTAVTFAPCVLHRLEVYMVAQNLSAGIFAHVGFTDVHLVLTALCATSAREHVNYQRMEYLGDALLKFASSIRLMARNLTWPESYLTAEKGRTVSNGYLAKASLDAGLDQYIIRTGFTGVKWRPQYLSDVHARQYEKQEAKQKDNFSTKTLADVVESLIGASYLSRATPETTGIPPSRFKPVEELLGHTFDRVSLLTEALTHPSYSPPHHERISSYQRLEFLGDAVIDYIISTRLYAHNPPLSHVLMHTFRTALVNGYLLAFLMFELKISEVRYDLPKTAKRKWDSVTEPGIQDFTRSLYHFLRHNSPDLLQARHAIHARHIGLRAAILEALYNGHEYPWAELEQARAEKVFSDIVESAIGAIHEAREKPFPTLVAIILHLSFSYSDIAVRSFCTCLFHPGQYWHCVAHKWS